MSLFSSNLPCKYWSVMFLETIHSKFAFIGHVNNIPTMHFLEFPEILSQNHICYHWLSVSGIPKIMHCGILINMPYWVVPIHDFCYAQCSYLSYLLVSRCRFESRNVTGRAPLGVSIAARGLMHCNTSTSKHGETSISILCAKKYVHLWNGYQMCSNIVILLSYVNYIIEMQRKYITTC